MNKEKASIMSLSEILSENIIIPFFQRPYTWSPKQVELLLKDIYEAKNKPKKEKSDIPYMMGSIIVYEDEDGYQIVDGQQRLTTLTIFQYILNSDQSDKVKGLLNQEFNHQISIENIKTNYTTIKNWLYNEDIESSEFKELSEYLNNKIQFCFIKAPSYDDAFVFFDSQNSRGKPLEKTDILKAHHLRFIKGAIVSQECARNWEIIDNKKYNKTSSFVLNHFMEIILGRGRSWIKGKGGYIDILEEFKSQRTERNKDGYFKLNKYNQPPIFKRWKFDDKEGDENDELEVELIFNEINEWKSNSDILKYLKQHSKDYLPLQITQTLEGGEQFFWYVKKYYEIYDRLFIKKDSDLPKAIADFYKDVLLSLSWNRGIAYLKEIYEGCLIFYYDKFGDDHFLEFALWLEHALFYQRYSLYSAGSKTIKNFITDEFNIFAIVNEAAFPEYCLDQMQLFIKGKYKTIKYRDVVPEHLKREGIKESYYKKFYEFFNLNKLDYPENLRKVKNNFKTKIDEEKTLIQNNQVK